MQKVSEKPTAQGVKSTAWLYVNLIERKRDEINNYRSSNHYYFDFN